MEGSKQLTLRPESVAVAELHLAKFLLANLFFVGPGRLGWLLGWLASVALYIRHG